MNGIIRTYVPTFRNPVHAFPVVSFFPAALVVSLSCSLAAAQIPSPAAQTDDTTAKEDDSAKQVAPTDSAGPPPVDDPIAQFEQKIADLEGDPSTATVEPAVARQLKQLLEVSRANVAKIRKLNQSTVETDAKTSDLPQEKIRLQTPVAPVYSTGDFLLETTEIESQLSELTKELADRKKLLIDSKAAVDSQVTRKQDQQNRITELQKNLDEIEAEQRRGAEDSLPSAHDLEIQTRLAAALAELELGRAELNRLERELNLKLPTSRVEHQKEQIEQVEKRRDVLQGLLDNAREVYKRELRSKGEDLQAKIASLGPADVLKLLDSPAELAGTNIRIVNQIAVREKEVKDLRLSNDQLESEAEKIQQRISEFGAEGVIGRDLLHLYDDATPRADIEKLMARIEVKLSERRIAQMVYTASLEDVEELVVSDDELLRIGVIAGQTDLLKSLGEDSRTLSSLLSDLDSESRRRLALMDEWEAYASEQALWFRSHPMLTLADLASLPAVMSDVAVEVRTGWKSNVSSVDGSFLVILIPAGLLIALLFGIQHRAKLGLDAVAVTAERRVCTTFRPTARAILLTFGLAAEWPLLMLVTGTLLQTQAVGSTLPGFGLALSELGIILLWLNCFRQALRSGGLAEVHFGWNNTVCQIVRQGFHGTIIVTLLPMFLFLVVRHGESDGDLIERSFFVLLMIVVGTRVIRLLLPPSNLLVSRLSASFSILAASRWIWTFGPVAILAVMIFLSVTGFHYTAVQLSIRCGSTLVVMSLLLLGHQLLTRWLRLHRTKTRLLAARARAMERSKADSDEADAPTSFIPAVEEDDADIEVFGLQADALLRNIACLTALACMWAIWLDVLPALRVLDHEPLWSVYEEVVVPTESGDETTVETRMERRAVTVGSLFLAVFTLTLTVIGVRQIPGLIEVVLRSESNLDAGVRYAISTVTRYVILLFGVAMMFRLMGLRWSQVQWLAAGLSVGLGFGMQEVFANFVSGLIILVERPIRIGDIVTIDGVSGVVSKIRIRATSITDWDRREYIVPNREFVTGKLLNWTLSDTTNRVMVNVGVAYGTDTNMAREIMLDVARNHPGVMSDPGPITTFENFGDSSLELVLRAYLPNLDNRLGTTTELFTQINLRFAEAGISIPFPQRDIHVQPDSSVTKAG
ncbi:MAG: mechanosensitive ion channel [Fuerstiella sp.]|nr:mechanosensitive ion channel [Fuerstiella sp.]MCP4511104.1 mechanosensitive ion channel [Fuerstiella sp.]